MFDEVVRINEQAGVIIIDEALLEMIPEEQRYSFYINLYSDGYEMYLDYYQLEGYLMQGGNSGYNNGNDFVDKELWEEKNGK